MLKKLLWIVPLSLLVILLLLAITGAIGYYFHQVDATEIGIVTYQGAVKKIVGPGLYNDPRPFADIKNVSMEGLQFEAVDGEVLTKDTQPIGVTVAGTVFRPGMELGLETYTKAWSQYEGILRHDTNLILVVDRLAYDSMKICVGNNTFKEAVVGEARDRLGECIRKQLNSKGEQYFLTFENVIVPNVALSDAMRQQLGDISQVINETTRKEKEGALALAEAQRILKTEQGKIMVEEGKQQELFRQKAKTAKLEQLAEIEKMAVIKATKANELEKETLSIAVAQKAVEAMELQARAVNADEAFLANIMQSNPSYVEMINVSRLAEALKSVEKILVIPDGTNPVMMLGDMLGMKETGVTPTFEVPPVE